MSTLSRDDVERLLHEPSAENRAIMAGKIAGNFKAGSLSEQERKIAEDIFRAMVRDAEVRVRKALADSLKDDPGIPHEVVKSLASDVEEISLPVIEHSSVLTDEDLVEIIQAQGGEAQQAVARRKSVSEDVAEALVKTDDEDVVAQLVANEGAKMNENQMERVLDRFGQSERVNAPMARRGQLPVRVAERLVSLVSENLKEHLVTHHELPPDTAADLVFESRERATVGLLDRNASAVDLLTLVDQLQAGKRLTPTLVVRAICMGDQAFFEAALARLADIPVSNAWQLIHDRGDLGLTRLFEKADMPGDLLPVARAALEVALETHSTSGDDRVAFRERMIERVLTKCETEFEGDSLDYFIAKLGAKKAA